MNQDHNQIETRLTSLDSDINLIIEYFIEELGFEGVVTFKDKPNTFWKSHYHNDDDYQIMLDGEMTIGMNGEFTTVKKGDFFFYPAKFPHDVQIGPNGAKYIVGTIRGDFESYYI
jgi:quercetin dioxygenase-like cupin family protein